MSRTDPVHIPTDFAPAERASGDELERAVAYFVEHPESFAILDSVPEMVLVVNPERQIVYSNAAARQLFGGRPDSQVFGTRPGELLGCDHAGETAGGCGTTKHCSVCGAARAILTGLAGEACVEECRLSLADGAGVLDLRVWASPHQAVDKGFCILAIKDIADEKRRSALERTFFHDILNTAGGLLGYAELMKMSSPEELAGLDVQDMIPQLANQLIEEIGAQRLLTQAEGGEVAVTPEAIDPDALLEQTVQTYARHSAAKGRTLALAPSPGAVQIESDPVMLSRIVGNMTKNALEACKEGEVVTLSWVPLGEGLEFRVHNPAVMPAEVQLQVFQRSFSTKGAGRGIGTYSMRLFGERYLGGKVGFESSEAEGTTFWVRLPQRP